MEITIQTLHGTFVVPETKTAALTSWLEANAIKLGGHPVVKPVSVREDQSRGFYTGTQLLND